MTYKEAVDASKSREPTMLKLRDTSAHEIDDWICRRLHEAMRTMLAAVAYADKSNQKREAFAVSLNCIQQCGLYECDLLWLVSQGYVIHLRECTEEAGCTRKFIAGGVTISTQSCFALTEPGEEFALAVCGGEGDALLTSAMTHDQLRPRWDSERRELFFRGHLIKRFRLPSRIRSQCYRHLRKNAGRVKSTIHYHLAMTKIRSGVSTIRFAI